MDLYTQLKNGLGSDYNVTLENGYITVTGDNASDFRISIPANHQGPIDVVMMYPGDAGNAGAHEINTSTMKENIAAVRDGNPDTLIVQSSAFNNEYQLVEVTDKIMNCTNLNYDRFVTRGHSAGCMGATHAAAIYAETHQNNSPPSVILVDSYYGYAGVTIRGEDIDTLNASGAQIIALTSSDQKKPSSHGLSGYIGNGAKFLFVKRADDSHISHARMNNEAYDMDIIGYVLGNDDAFSKYKVNYQIDIYDPDTGQLIQQNVKPSEAHKYLNSNPRAVASYGIKNIEYVSTANFEAFTDRVKNLLNLKDFPTIDENTISSDKKYVIDNMSKIRGLVKTTGALSGIGGCGTSSSTMVPVRAVDFVYNYSRMILLLLEKISNESVNIVSIATGIDMDDMKLQLVADNLDDLIIEDEDKDKDTGTKKKKKNNNPFSGSGVPNNRQKLPNKQTLRFDDLKSDSTRIVFKNGDNCKIVFDKNNNDITGMTCYYNFDTAEKASEMIDNVTAQYSQMNGFQQVVQEGQYLKVIFTEEYCSEMTIDDVMTQYANLERV